MSLWILQILFVQQVRLDDCSGIWSSSIFNLNSSKTLLSQWNCKAFLLDRLCICLSSSLYEAEELCLGELSRSYLDLMSRFNSLENSLLLLCFGMSANCIYGYDYYNFSVVKELFGTFLLISILVHRNEIIAQLYFLINQTEQLPSSKEGRVNLNCFALATNQDWVSRWWLWVSWHMAPHYSAVTVLLVCVSPVSLTGKLFSQPFHHFYSSDTSINYSSGSLLLHCYIQEYY